MFRAATRLRPRCSLFNVQCSMFDVRYFHIRHLTSHISRLETKPTSGPGPKGKIPLEATGHQMALQPASAEAGPGAADTGYSFAAAHCGSLDLSELSDRASTLISQTSRNYPPQFRCSITQPGTSLSTLRADLTDRLRKTRLRLLASPAFPEMYSRVRLALFTFNTLIERHRVTQKKEGELLPLDYFIRAKKILDEIHKQKIVHLGLRRGNNWIVCSDGMPAVIVFLSALNASFLPEFIRSKLSEIDLQGIYKCWITT